MQTRLGLFCDKVIEAGWLAAAIVAPLYFNVISSRIFEPDKITLVRYIALLMILAWLIRLLENAVTTGTNEEPASTSAVTSLLAWLRTPLIIPTLFLVAVYLIATVFSIVPHISLWGSYQRLQGTYSMLSYVVIFLLLMQTMRTREQVDRLITTMILTSLPAALYGILQHFDLDPLPWGGDTQTRVASMMGNAIFIGAYLIMAVPLTLARLMDRTTRGFVGELEGLDARPRYVRAALLALPTLVGVALFALVFQAANVYAQANSSAGVNLSPVDWGVLVVSLVVVLAAIVLVAYARRFPPAAFEGVVYALILGAQLACIWYSVSRGPQIGLVVGLVLFLLLFAIRRRMRVAFVSTLVLSVVLAGFIGVLNIKDGPLAAIRDVPGINRLARLSEEAAGVSGTGTVRILIWEGAADMVRADPARMIIGYGPEAMHVGYNKFYPPDLAHFERRNASPDRSHNETWDSLVFTGLVGLVAYLALFGAVFYYALDALGLIVRRIRWWLVGGYAVAVAVICVGAVFAPSMWVAVSGMLVAVLVGAYVLGYGVLGFLRGFPQREEPDSHDLYRDLLLIGLLTAIVAHFVEIQFGIAIVSTRTDFWLYAGLIVVMGFLLVRPAEQTSGSRAPGVVAAEAPSFRKSSRRKKRRDTGRTTRRSTRQSTAGASAWWRPLIPAGLIGAFILTVLAADLFIPNQQITAAIEYQYTALRLTIMLVWLAMACVEVMRLMAHESDREPSKWLLAFLIYSLIVWAGMVLFMLAQRMLLEVNSTTGLTVLGTRPDPDSSLVVFYIWLFLALVALGLGLHLATRVRPQRVIQGWIALLYPVFALVVLAASVFLNLNVIRANMWFKQGEYLSEQQHDYNRAIYYYKRALELTPREDWYYLFLGKAYLDLLPQVQDASQRAALLQESETELLRALEVNPLNTDHTANLARLHRLGTQNYNKSLEYYQKAVELSPHNAQLFNELGQTYQLLGQLDMAEQTYQHSLELDPLYVNTYVLLGELYRSEGNITQTLELYTNGVHTFETSQPYLKDSLVQLLTEVGRVYLERKQYDQAIPVYEQAIEIDPASLPAHSALGYVYVQQADALKKAGQDAEAQARLAQAQAEFERCVEIAPRDYTSRRNLASVYLQQGAIDKSIQEYEVCAQLKPDDIAIQQALAALYLQTGRRAEAIAAYEAIVKVAPTDAGSLKNLALLYRDAGRTAEALAVAKRALALIPNDAELLALVAQLQG
ncbi:MAG: tetratricopeptide repeat protein [Chloroflexi bacterium]|nr:tetratricopeptide repeat protein [Chloroflexota bacterium]